MQEQDQEPQQQRQHQQQQQQQSSHEDYLEHNISSNIAAAASRCPSGEGGVSCCADSISSATINIESSSGTINLDASQSTITATDIASTISSMECHTKASDINEGTKSMKTTATTPIPIAAIPLNNRIDTIELYAIERLIWGDSVRQDVFQRWSQGFEFSEFEPTAVVQKQGGPCAVIAPVQAYLLKSLIMQAPRNVHFQMVTHGKCQELLIDALLNILINCRTPHFRLVILTKNSNDISRTAEEQEKLHNKMATSKIPATCDESKFNSEQNVINMSCDLKDINVDLPTTSTGAVQNKAQPGMKCDFFEATAEAVAAGAISAATADIQQYQVELTPNEFHERLKVLYFDDIHKVRCFYHKNLQQLHDKYAVLLFMYSVFLTKGSEQVISELLDTSEPLIHNTYGYGAQALINLMLTGRAVAHVWDNDQDVGGLKLRGISEQSDIGFITLMEQLRYCTVGSFYKNPRYPIWVMGSDTHLTVLFSNEKRLASPETPSEIGRRVFKSFDPEGNNFISTSALQDVLAALDFVSEIPVSIMQKRLDPENLGIILLNAFMDEFYPLERRPTPDTFDLMHYNGIPGSNEHNQVRYYRGSAVLLEGDIKNICTSNAMLTCLQTKWPNIEVTWHETHTPSLN